MGTYRRNYLSRHGKAYRYRRAIPIDLQPILGKKEWSKYLGMVGAHDAEKQARALAVEHDALIKRLEDVPADHKVTIVNAGGVAGLARANMALAVGLPFLEHAAHHFDDVGLDLEDEHQGQQALAIAQARRSLARRQDEIGVNERALESLEGKSHRLDVLFTTWLNAKPRNSPANVQHHRLYLDRFAAAVGNITPKAVARQHAIKFRDILEAKPTLTHRSVKKQIECLNAMFNLALSRGIVDANPFHGVKATKRTSGKFHDEAVDRTFTGHQVQLIFDTMKRVGMSADFQWVMQLCAYHGMRSNEAAQLRCEDIVTLHGVPSIRIRDKADGQHVKNLPSVRDVPIHPACLAIVAYAEGAAQQATAAGTEPWLFQSFPTHWKSGRRGAYFQRYGGEFLRKTCKIVDRNLTLHSLRHTWIANANALLVPDKIAYAITGHKIRGHHGNYGKLPPVTECLPWLARIDPFR